MHPHRAYYKACVGTWRGEIAMTLSDRATLRGSGMSWFDRLGVHLMAGWPKWAGRFVLHTAVRFESETSVVHTTTVRWLGVPVMRSTELFELLDDGRALRVGGDLSGTGSVDESTTQAEYDMIVRGAPIHQYTTREPDIVTVTQEGPGFRSVQRLLRQS